MYAIDVFVNANCAFASSQHIFLKFGLMLERWIILSGAAFSPFLYFIFVEVIYNSRKNNIYNNNYASAIRHNMLRCGEWRKHNYLDIL